MSGRVAAVSTILHCSKTILALVTLGNVGLKVQCSELVHSLFGLGGLWWLQFRLRLLGHDKNKDVTILFPAIVFFYFIFFNLREQRELNDSLLAPPGVSSASRSPGTADLWLPGT